VLDRGKQVAGSAFTFLGPAPYPQSGNILDNPCMVWTEDQWNEQRTMNALQRIAGQGDALSGYWKSQYISKASMYWHNFYKRNSDHFYKDRHYLHIVFPELMPEDDKLRHSLEVGSGVGNAILPLIEMCNNLHVNAIDFASSAISILKNHPIALRTNRVTASVCCVVNDSLPVSPSTMDFVLCMFVLSAIDPEHHLGVIAKLAKALKPGGKLLLRDYGRFYPITLTDLSVNF
jgi:SAM-dependent methyltransferase